MKIIRLLMFFILLTNCKTGENISSNGPDLGSSIETKEIFLNNHHYKNNAGSVSQHLFLRYDNIGGDNPREFIKYFGFRSGSLNDGLQDGKWVSTRSYFSDSLNSNDYKTYIFREEYFKNGLRDSVYKIYNKKGKVIYSTMFEKGTGIEKDFYQNGKLYYEIAIKDGYFTDTLKINNENGTLYQKRLYKNDTLVNFEDNKWSLTFKYHPNNNNYIEVDSYEIKGFKRGKLINTFSYKTKEEYDNDYFVEHTLKKL